MKIKTAADSIDPQLKKKLNKKRGNCSRGLSLNLDIKGDEIFNGIADWKG